MTATKTPPKPRARAVPAEAVIDQAPDELVSGRIVFIVPEALQDRDYSESGSPPPSSPPPPKGYGRPGGKPLRPFWRALIALAFFVLALFAGAILGKVQQYVEDGLERRVAD